MNTREEVRKAIQNVQIGETEAKVDSYASIIVEILLDIRDLLEKNNKLVETSKRRHKLRMKGEVNPLGKEIEKTSRCA